MTQSKVEKSESLLDAMDASVKRLVTPTAFLIAAAVISQGLKIPESNHALIYVLMIGLGLLSGIYFIFSIGVITNKIDSAITNKKLALFIALSYTFMYFVLWVVVIKLGMGKI